MTTYAVTSLSSLGLFGQLMLTKNELDLLPKGSLAPILDGLSNIINQYIRKYPGSLSPSRVMIKEEGQIHVKFSDGREIQVGHIKDDPKLLETTKRVLDLARVRVPSAQQAPRVIPTKMIHHGMLDQSANKPTALEAESLSVSTNTNSVARNVSIAAGVFTAGVAVSGFIGGLTSVAIAQSIMKSANVKLHNAQLCGDKEGQIDARLFKGVGQTFGVVGATMVAGFLPSMVSVLPSGVATSVSNLLLPVKSLVESTGINLTSAIGFAGNISIIGMSLFMLAQNGYNWYHLSKFRDELGGVLDNGALACEEKANQGLRFLSQQFKLTEAEWLDLKEKFPADEKALAIAVENKAKEKFARLVRRVGIECATKIVTQVAFLQEAIRNGDTDAIVKAIDLLEEVDQCSYQTRVKQTISLLLSLLYLTVGILSFTTPLGPLVPILFAIGAAVFNLVDSSSACNGVTYLAAKVHKACNRVFGEKEGDHETRWGVVTRPANKFKVDGQWELKRIKNKLTASFEQSLDLTIDGEEINDFEMLLKKLRLDSLDFEKMPNDTSLTLEQQRALKILEELIDGIVAASKKAGQDVQLELLRATTQIDPRTGIGTTLVTANFAKST